jgi:DNA polymerase elongation subunit (family B)
MLYDFFNNMVPKMPLLTGWNFLNYDWLYLVNRCKKISKWVNGREYRIDPRVSSITKRMNKKWGAEYEVPAHRMIFDYMQLYEICDTSIKVKESSSLDFVSSKLVGVDKIKYSGSLQTLYEEDFETFMYYNAVDSVLVQKIHEARNYISIIFAISSLAQIRIVDVVSQMNNALGSLAITEGVLRNKFREMDNIVLFKDDKGEVESTIAGGWVKDPVVGLNQWVVCYDFASLYPTTQRQFFIAPENFVGLQDPNDKTKCENGRPIDPENHVVCVNGVVFEKRLSPTLRMLEDVYADRKKNKKIMMDKKEEKRLQHNFANAIQRRSDASDGYWRIVTSRQRGLSRESLLA